MINLGVGYAFLIPPSSSSNAQPPVRCATLQEISLDVSYSLKELYGAKQFAEAVALTEAKLTGKIKMGQVKAAVFAAVFGGSLITATSPAGTPSQKAPIIDEPGTLVTAAYTAQCNATVTASIATTVLTVTAVTSGVLAPGQTVTGGTTLAGTLITSQLTSTEVDGHFGGKGTYAVNLTQTVTSGTLTASSFDQDLGVIDASGNQLVNIGSGTPSNAAQYTAIGGVYTFFTGTTGTYRFSYSKFIGSGKTVTITNQLMGTGNRFQLICQNAYASLPATTGYSTGGGTLSVKLSSVFIPKLAMALKNNDFTVSDLDIQAEDDGSGNIGEISLTN